MAPLRPRSRCCATAARVPAAHRACATTPRQDGVSPGHLPPGRARAVHRAGRLHPGDRRHTCMGGGEQRARLGRRRDRVRGAGRTRASPPSRCPSRSASSSTGRLRPNVTAKDVMLHILRRYAKREETLDRVMEFGGPGVSRCSMDERATLANMATECSAGGGDLRGRRGDLRLDRGRGVDAPSRSRRSAPASSRPIPVRTTTAASTGSTSSADRRRWSPSPAIPPTGRRMRRAGPRQDRHRLRRLVHRRQERRPRLLRAGDAGGRDGGRSVGTGVDFFIQFGCEAVEGYARSRATSSSSSGPASR